MDASGPEAEFFNSERRNLITDIFRAINQYEIRSNLPDGTETLNAAAISALWLSDFTQLELLSKRFRTDASGTLRAMNKAVLATQLVSRWKGGDFARKTPKNTTDLCRRRDGNCVITNSTGETHAVPIVSFNSRKKRPLSTTEPALNLFWGKDNIQKVKSCLQNTASTENYLLLSPTAHAYWNKKLFALKPMEVSEDKKSIQLRFHWLLPDATDNLKLTTTALSNDDDGFVVPNPDFRRYECGFRRYHDSRMPCIHLYSGESGKMIPSGHLITLTTPDPDVMPLPAFEVLQLQWDLHRFATLSTAAGYSDGNCEDGNEGDEEGDDGDDGEEDDGTGIGSSSDFIFVT